MDSARARREATTGERNPRTVPPSHNGHRRASREPDRLWRRASHRRHGSPARRDPSPRIVRLARGTTTGEAIVMDFKKMEPTEARAPHLRANAWQKGQSGNPGGTTRKVRE